jgi:hypothetical protein
MYIMRKYHLWIALIATLFCVDASAQSLKRKVINSAGGTYENRTYQLCFSIGEPVTLKYSNSKYVLTQGFIQPSWRDRYLNQTQNLLTFTAYAQENIAKLVLVSLAPIETDYLVLERLNNETGKFDILEQVNAQFDKNIIEQETLSDVDPQDGENSYRVKQVFDDGTFRYTDVQKLTFNTTQVSVYPNPATEFLKVDLSTYEGKEASVSVFSVNGVLMHRQIVDKASRQAIQIPLDKIESGYYQIFIQVKGKKAILKQVVVQK